MSADKILIVEDSKTIHKALKAALENVCGAEVLVAETYETAVEVIDAQGSNLFLAILDLALPDASHGEIVDYAVAHKVPGIVFTSTFDSATRELILSKGIIDYVIKNSRAVEELVRTVHRLQLNREVRILAVDDSPTALNIIRSVLSPHMFQVLTAESAQEALELLAREKCVDLVLTDYEMPGMDGVELTSHIRRTFSKEEMAIVGISSAKDDNLAANFLKNGANDFMCKPFGREEFYCRVLNNIEALEHIRRVEMWTRKLQESEERYRGLVEYAPIGIFQSTPQGRYISVNTRLVEMYGYDSEQDLLENVHDIGTQMYVDLSEREEIKGALEKGIVDCKEIRRRRKDGSVIWVSLSMRAVRDRNGDILHYEGFSRDITIRKLDEELRVQIERIVRHDLRAPASSAIGVARMLRAETGVPEELSELLTLLEQSGQNMLDILDSSLDLYKIETGTYQARIGAFDCLVIVRAIIDALKTEKRFSKIQLEVRVNGHPPKPDSGCPGLGDPKLFRTAMQNLLVNALEASSPGSEVIVELFSGKDCRIEVWNKGLVPLEIRDRFFDKYVTKGKPKGTGIGTYSAKMMITAQGGKITMRTSDEDNETVVTVKLPR